MLEPFIVMPPSDLTSLLEEDCDQFTKVYSKEMYRKGSVLNWVTNLD